MQNWILFNHSYQEFNLIFSFMLQVYIYNLRLLGFNVAGSSYRISYSARSFSDKGSIALSRSSLKIDSATSLTGDKCRLFLFRISVLWILCCGLPCGLEDAFGLNKLIWLSPNVYIFGDWTLGKWPKNLFFILKTSCCFCFVIISIRKGLISPRRLTVN